MQNNFLYNYSNFPEKLEEQVKNLQKQSSHEGSALYRLRKERRQKKRIHQKAINKRLNSLCLPFDSMKKQKSFQIAQESVFQQSNSQRPPQYVSDDGLSSKYVQEGQTQRRLNNYQANSRQISPPFLDINQSSKSRKKVRNSKAINRYWSRQQKFKYFVCLLNLKEFMGKSIRMQTKVYCFMQFYVSQGNRRSINRKCIGAYHSNQMKLYHKISTIITKFQSMLKLKPQDLPLIQNQFQENIKLIYNCFQNIDPQSEDELTNQIKFPIPFCIQENQTKQMHNLIQLEPNQLMTQEKQNINESNNQLRKRSILKNRLLFLLEKFQSIEKKKTKKKSVKLTRQQYIRYIVYLKAHKNLYDKASIYVQNELLQALKNYVMQKKQKKFLVKHQDYYQIHKSVDKIIKWLTKKFKVTEQQIQAQEERLKDYKEKHSEMYKRLQKICCLEQENLEVRQQLKQIVKEKNINLEFKEIIDLDNEEMQQDQIKVTQKVKIEINFVRIPSDKDQMDLQQEMENQARARQKWVPRQNARFLAFIIINRDRFGNRRQFRQKNIFAEMSEYVQTRTKHQCTLHFNRIIRQIQNFQTVKARMISNYPPLGEMINELVENKVRRLEIVSKPIILQKKDIQEGQIKIDRKYKLLF